MAIRKPAMPIMVVCCVLLGWLLWACAPALAAPPEAPSAVVVESIKATEATVHGVLNPGKTGAPGTYETGTYEFIYKESKTECEGGGASTAGVSLGAGKEEVPAQTLTSLKQDSEYTICLRAKTAGGTTVGPKLTFTTALPPETPVTDAPNPIAATTATFKGMLNPKNKGEAGSYEFFYRVSSSECQGENATPTASSLGAKEEAVSVPVTGLQPSVQYTVCLLARNTAGETALGAPMTFSTPAGAPAVDGESVAEGTLTSYTLQAQINANNQKTAYFFEYGTKATGETLEGTVKKVEGGVLPGEFGDRGVSAPTGAVLTPGTTYYFRVVADNGAQPAVDGKVQSFATPEVPVTESATAKGTSAVVLKGELNPHGATGKVTYQFDYYTDGSCKVPKVTPEEEVLEGKQQAAQPSTPPVEIAEGKEAHIQYEATELEPNLHYTFCLIVTNASGGQAEATTEASAQTARMAPQISGESFTETGPTGATLTAEVNTENQESRYHFKYGTSAEFTAGTAKTTVEEVLAPNDVPAPASARLYGLQPSTEYQFRLVVTNISNETSEGTLETFTTLPAESGVGAVPDKRVDEMVTPVENLDSEVYVPYSLESGFGDGYETSLNFQVAADGNRVMYEAEPTHNGGGESAGNGLGSAFLATRAPQGGWSQISLQPAGRRGTNYFGFSSDLTVGIMRSENETSFANQEGELPGPPSAAGEYSNLYLTRTGSETYDPLNTVKPPNRSSEETGGHGGWIRDAGERRLFPIYAGGSADMSQLLFLDNDDLLQGEGRVEKELAQGAKSEVEQHEDNAYLYEWTAGGLHLVDLLPEDKGVARDSIFGTTQQGDPGLNPPNFSNVISSDGSRIFWSTLNPEHEPTALYVRENADQPQSPLNGQGECTDSGDACTVQVDKAVGGGGRYWAATSDGSKVFFTKGNLYEYDVNTGVTSDLTPGVEVQGVLGASQTGDYVYYADAASKLYVLHESAGEWQAPVAIATLTERDGTNVFPYEGDLNKSDVGDWIADIGQRTSEVTPNGLGLVFMSQQGLDAQGFPNGAPTKPYQEHVYVYEAADNSLFCASCSQSGEPSGGESYLPVDWSDNHMPTWISEDGDEVFFDSSAGLLPQDTNKTQDVYEWEREGTGGCAVGTGLRGGCIYLLSGGQNPFASSLIGASADGSNVFMVTRAQLVTEDKNDNDDLYDARAEGVRPLNPPECTGTGCQGIPGAPPVFATPASVTFEGVGNFEPPAPAKAVAKAKPKSLTKAEKLKAALRTCKKQKHRAKRESCEAQVRKLYGPKKTKSSAKGRK
jgi:hypothetical protein